MNFLDGSSSSEPSSPEMDHSIGRVPIALSPNNITSEHFFAALHHLLTATNSSTGELNLTSAFIGTGSDYDLGHNILGLVPGDEDIPIFTHTIPADIVIIAYGLIVLVSLIGNLLVCKIAFSGRSAGRNNRLRTTTDLLIGSLAVSDLIMTSINIPFTIARLLLPHWPFGSLLCYCVPLVQTCCVYVSTFTMAAIAMHRWRTVSAHHSRSGHLPAPYSNRTIIGAVWLLAAALATPTVAFNTLRPAIVNGRPVFRCRVYFPFSGISLALTVVVFITQYLAPLILTAVLYVNIAKVVSRQGRMTAGAPGMVISGDDEKRRKRHLETKRRRIVMLSAVVAVFAICWLPINLYHLSVDLGIFGHQTSVFLMCHWFAMSSVCYNSLIYCWLNANFRASAFDTFSTIFSCFRRSPKSGLPNGQTMGVALDTQSAKNDQTGSGHLGQPSDGRRGGSVSGACGGTATTVLVDPSGRLGVNSRVEVPSSCQLLPLSANSRGCDDDDYDDVDDDEPATTTGLTTDIEMSRRASQLGPLPVIGTASSRKSSYRSMATGVIAGDGSPFIDIIVQRPDATLSFESDLIDESCF